jgi:choline-sulfatase
MGTSWRRVISGRALASGAIAAMCVSCADPPAPAPTNLLLVTIDTLRPDHLGAYGYDRDTSPQLDRFAASAVVFDRAYGSSSWTLPSIASLLTGEYPSGHRTRGRRSSLAPGFETLTERLESAGFATAAVVSHVFFARRYGLDQGFSLYDDEQVRKQFDESHKAVSSPAITAKGRAWLEQRYAADDGRRWFLWLHYFDPHSEYVSHPDTQERFGETPLDRYDGEIAFTDANLGEILDTLEAFDAVDDTLVIVASDHGEAFGEHGLVGHRLSLFEEELRVALLMRVPGVAPRRVSALASLVDVAPTALELLRIEPQPPKAGVSLVPLLQGASTPRSAVIAELRSALDWKRIDAVVTDGWKLTQHRVHGVSLYDLASDPNEQHNVAAARPRITKQLQAKLRSQIIASRKRGETVKTAPVAPLDPLLRQQLEALGYADPPESPQ